MGPDRDLRAIERVGSRPRGGISGWSFGSCAVLAAAATVAIQAYAPVEHWTTYLDRMTGHQPTSAPPGPIAIRAAPGPGPGPSTLRDTEPAGPSSVPVRSAASDPARMAALPRIEAPTLPPPQAQPSQAPVASAPIPTPGTEVAATGSVEPPAAVPAGAVVPDADTPMDCLPSRLRDSLEAAAHRFGTVTVVSTTHLHTGNHNRGRAKIHGDCMAADIRTAAPPGEVMAFLRSRPGTGGMQAFQNGLIHVDDAAAHPAQAYGRRDVPDGVEAGDGKAE